MRKIIADEQFVRQLNGKSESVEVCDQAGKLLGHFVSPDEYHRLIYDAVTNAPEPTPEELKRSFATGPGEPLAQIWKDLARE
jgi:hypothetical protein